MKERMKLKKTLQDHLDGHGARIAFAAASCWRWCACAPLLANLALVLNPFAKPSSNERRLQRFFAGFKLYEGASRDRPLLLGVEQDKGAA